jgi:hypothetical protein
MILGSSSILPGSDFSIFGSSIDSNFYFIVGKISGENLAE